MIAENVTGFLDLSRLCWKIQQEKLKNESVMANQSEVPKHESLLTNILLEGLNSTQMVNVTLKLILTEFELFTEWYFITVVAGVGIGANLAVMVLLGRDKAMRQMSYILHMLLLAMEVAYLTAVIVFIQFRHFFFTDLYQQLRLMTYVTMAMSFSQCVSMWLLYVVATDSYRAVKLYQKPAKILQLPHAKRNVFFVIVGTILFHIPYIPHVRLELYKLDPKHYNPCNVPIEEHWEFEAPSGDHDLYYILYYSLVYSLFVFGIPFLMIAARDKDIIDLIHDVMDVPSYKKSELIHNCYTAKVVSIFCNVQLFCISPKLVLLVFQMTDYAVHFIGAAQIFFEFFNVMANLLLVFKSSIYLFLFLMFHPRVKVIICTACCYRCYNKARQKVRGHHLHMPLVTVTHVDKA